MYSYTAPIALALVTIGNHANPLTPLACSTGPISIATPPKRLALSMVAARAWHGSLSALPSSHVSVDSMYIAKLDSIGMLVIGRSGRQTPLLVAQSRVGKRCRGFDVVTSLLPDRYHGCGVVG